MAPRRSSTEREGGQLKEPVSFGGSVCLRWVGLLGHLVLLDPLHWQIRFTCWGSMFSCQSEHLVIITKLRRCTLQLMRSCFGLGGKHLCRRNPHVPRTPGLTWPIFLPSLHITFSFRTATMMSTSPLKIEVLLVFSRKTRPIPRTTPGMHIHLRKRCNNLNVISRERLGLPSCNVPGVLQPP